MDINYFMKIQNAYGTKSKREMELAKVNREMSKHFKDTYDTETVLINGVSRDLMIIKDTDGNTFKKKIKSRHGEKFNLGDYVIWNNQYWLITLLDPDEKTWNRGYMYLCTVPLRWQNTDGQIIERWGYSEDFTKYSSGVIGNSTLQVGDNQYGLTLPIDSETKKLKRDLRFAIDLDDVEEPDIYKLSNRKVNLNNNMYFNRGSTMILTLSYDAFNRTKDKHVLREDGSQVWICDYHSPAPSPEPPAPDETTDLSAVISGGNTLRCGRAKTWTVTFWDRNGIEITGQNFQWRVDSKYTIKQVVDGQRIQLRVDDEQFIGCSFLLSVINKGILAMQIKIRIIEGL